ncbi:zinc finger protein 107-like [Micropterus dolomieu]|uniref:zinc finger protein 107-like n=1 Tax=Micropterus dolomieu TaxID=147949 RepID=UPI001E8E6C43|nr:zinc finger protein 107-like [Micropterus dolomieu]
MSACCVSGCKNRHSSTSKLKLYRIPSGYRPFQANRRRLWLQAIQQANGSTEELKGNARICGAHFISGEASMDHDSPDFVPSVFSCTKQRANAKKKFKRFYGRRKRRRRAANVKTAEKTTPPRADSPMDLQSPVLMEEAQTPSASSVPKEGQTLVKDAETETKTVKSQTISRPNKASPSFKAPAGFPKLDKRIPILLLKPVFAPASGYRCELCNQNFTSVSQLLKHKPLHKEEKSFTCEICGQVFTSQADFTEHQRVHEPSFPCNICDRSFTTSHNLKRHKLLHVKDGRKCPKCGVLFCQRHKHILFLPQAESLTKSEQDSFITEPQNESSNLMPENTLPEKPEASQTADLNDDAQSTMTPTPTAHTVLPKPGPLSKTHKALPPASHTRILSEIPIPVLIKPSSVPRPPRPVPGYPRNPGTSSQLRSPLPTYPATFIQPHLPQHPDLPSSLKIFSPQYLTSALLKVTRNYEYILNKPRVVKKEDIVKVEQCELPLIPPDEHSVKREKKERTAYDLEIVL